MNRSIVRYVIGQVVKFEGALLLFPCIISIFYKEKIGLVYFIVGVLSFLAGIAITHRKPASTVFYLKEGCVVTAFSWIIISLIGCLPFVITREIPNFINALFETVSGFTTTGASVIDNVETLSYTANFWRCFTHWIGGMGVLVFLLMIIPLSGGSNINLMRAESPGPSVGKLVPRMKESARILYLIYIGLTVIEFIFLICGKMPVYDAICTSVATAGTGGFGIKADSITSYSPYIQWVVTVFMILFGVNFNAYYFIIFRKWSKAFSMEEVKWYFVIIIASIGIISVNGVRTEQGPVSDIIRTASFQVGSIITTTGFSTADFNTWNQSSKLILVLLMFIGACAGSTGGGFKISRIVILFKTIAKELWSYIHPKSVRKIKIDGVPVEHDVVRSVNVYLITYVIIFCVSVLIISFEQTDIVTTITSVAATFNNIGPGLEMVGPASNFGFFSGWAKCVFMFDMIAGRLELFPLLLIFHPALVKEWFVRKPREKANKIQSSND